MNMNETIRIISGLREETQNELYKKLEEMGFTSEEIDTIKSVAFYHKLFTDQRLYNTLLKTMAEEAYKELNRI